MCQKARTEHEHSINTEMENILLKNCLFNILYAIIKWKEQQK